MTLENSFVSFSGFKADEVPLRAMGLFVAIYGQSDGQTVDVIPVNRVVKLCWFKDGMSPSETVPLILDGLFQAALMRPFQIESFF